MDPPSRRKLGRLLVQEPLLVLAQAVVDNEITARRVRARDHADRIAQARAARAALPDRAKVSCAQRWSQNPASYRLADSPVPKDRFAPCYSSSIRPSRQTVSIL